MTITQQLLRVLELQEKLNAGKTPKTEEGRKVLEAADLYLEEIQKNLGYVQETAAFNASCRICVPLISALVVSL